MQTATPTQTVSPTVTPICGNLVPIAQTLTGAFNMSRNTSVTVSSPLLFSGVACGGFTLPLGPKAVFAIDLGNLPLGQPLQLSSCVPGLTATYTYMCECCQGLLACIICSNGYCQIRRFELCLNLCHLLHSCHFDFAGVGYGCPNNFANFQCIQGTGAAGYNQPCGQQPGTPAGATTYYYSYQSAMTVSWCRRHFIALNLSWPPIPKLICLLSAGFIILLHHHYRPHTPPFCRFPR